MQNLSAVAIQSPQVTTPHTGHIARADALPPIVEIPEPETQVVATTSDVNTTLAIDSPGTQLDTAPMHQSVMKTSDVLIDVRWWLHLTLQEIQISQKSNDLDVARIIVRQCTKIVREYRGQANAVTFQELLMELSEFSSPDRLHHPLNCMFATEDWLHRGYRCRMRVMHLKFQDPRLTNILSLYFRIRDPYGILLDRTFETRLYLDAETHLSTGNQAYIIVGGHHSLKKATCFFKGYVQDDISKQSLEAWQKTLLEQPCAVFLRDDLGNVSLSVSRLFSPTMVIALMIQGRSEIGPTVYLSIASQARIASLQCLQVGTFLLP